MFEFFLWILIIEKKGGSNEKNSCNFTDLHHVFFGDYWGSDYVPVWCSIIYNTDIASTNCIVYIQNVG